MQNGTVGPRADDRVEGGLGLVVTVDRGDDVGNGLLGHSRADEGQGGAQSRGAHSDSAAHEGEFGGGLDRPHAGQHLGAVFDGDAGHVIADLLEDRVVGRQVGRVRRERVDAGQALGAASGLGEPAGQRAGAGDTREAGLSFEGRVEGRPCSVPTLDFGVARAKAERDAALRVFGRRVEHDRGAALVVEAGEVPEEAVGLPAPERIAGGRLVAREDDADGALERFEHSARAAHGTHRGRW